MKLKLLLTLIILTILFSCKNSSSDKLKGIVSKYIKEKVKNPGSYNSLYFSSIDTTFAEHYQDSLLMEYKPDYKYSIEHVYEIENSDKEKIKMSVSFYFDSTLKIIETSPEGLNGDYGQFTGNVYWKYNNFVGNKPDAGSKIILYALDTLRKDIKYETTCDVMGNFKFDKVLSGEYLLVVNSKNTTNSPDDHLDELRIYSYDLNKLFGYNIYKEAESEFKEYEKLDSVYREARLAYYKDYDVYSKSSDTYRKLEKQKMDLAGKLIEKIPLELRSKIGLYSSYSNKFDLSNITINEGKTTNKVIDFGITYF